MWFVVSLFVSNLWTLGSSVLCDFGIYWLSSRTGISMMSFRVNFILFASSSGLCSMTVAFPGYLHIRVIWASEWQNLRNGIYAQQRLRSALASIRPVWSDSLLCAQWVAKDPNFLHADSEDSDQTGRKPRLIWVFAGRTRHFVGFVMRWLLYEKKKKKKRCIILKGKTTESNIYTQKLEWRHFVGQTS